MRRINNEYFYFFSYPKPFFKRQEKFIEKVIQYLQERELQPRTLGVTDYDMDAPFAWRLTTAKEDDPIWIPKEKITF